MKKKQVISSLRNQIELKQIKRYVFFTRRTNCEQEKKLNWMTIKKTKETERERNVSKPAYMRANDHDFQSSEKVDRWMHLHTCTHVAARICVSFAVCACVRVCSVLPFASFISKAHSCDFTFHIIAQERKEKDSAKMSIRFGCEAKETTSNRERERRQKN